MPTSRYLPKPYPGARVNEAHPLCPSVAFLINERGGIPIDAAKLNRTPDSLGGGLSVRVNLEGASISWPDADDYFRWDENPVRGFTGKTSQAAMSVLVRWYRNNTNEALAWQIGSVSDTNASFGIGTTSAGRLCQAYNGMNNHVDTVGAGFVVPTGRFFWAGIMQRSAASRDFFLDGSFEGNTDTPAFDDPVYGGMVMGRAHVNSGAEAQHANGYIGLVYAWPFALTRRQMQSMADNPYQVLTQRRRGAVKAPAAAGGGGVFTPYYYHQHVARMAG